MRALSVLTFAAAVAFAISPALTPDFGGFDPELYPNPQLDPPVQPAGYAFAIWGVIYLWLLVSTGFGLVRRHDAPDWAPHRAPLLVSLATGAIWLPVAMVSPIWATVLIFVMLASTAVSLARAPTRDRWLARAPIALYAGWLTAASFASLGLTGAGYGLLLGEVGWAYLGVILAFLTTLAVHAMQRDEPVYFVSVIWALVAIAMANWGGVQGVAWAALAGAAGLTALMLASILRARAARG